jgi:hypothetical protein
VSSSVSRFESANLILDIVIVPASMCPTAGGTQSGPFKVRYGTPADLTSEAIKSLVKALKSLLSSQRALIKTAWSVRLKTGFSVVNSDAYRTYSCSFEMACMRIRSGPTAAF